MEKNGKDLNGFGQSPPPVSTVRPRNPKQTQQAACLQRFCFDAVVALKRDLSKSGQLSLSRDDAQAIAQLVRSWDIAANRLRVLRGRGLPASVRSRPGKITTVEPLHPA